jgi:hypothetical protein
MRSGSVEYINITDEMIQVAEREAMKRDKYIRHHFDVKHMNRKERDIVGFLGEFAASELLGNDWKKMIRKSYETIDNGDGTLHNLIYDLNFRSLKMTAKLSDSKDVS